MFISKHIHILKTTLECHLVMQWQVHSMTILMGWSILSTCQYRKKSLEISIISQQRDMHMLLNVTLSGERDMSQTHFSLPFCFFLLRAMTLWVSSRNRPGLPFSTKNLWIEAIYNIFNSKFSHLIVCHEFKSNTWAFLMQLFEVSTIVHEQANLHWLNKQFQVQN